eukprot:2530992-Rhodomonas_salina.2
MPENLVSNAPSPRTVRDHHPPVLILVPWQQDACQHRPAHLLKVAEAVGESSVGRVEWQVARIVNEEPVGHIACIPRIHDRGPTLKDMMPLFRAQQGQFQSDNLGPENIFKAKF